MEPQGRGSAEEPGILLRPRQWCVEPSRGLEDPKLPLSVPTGVRLAPTLPKLGERQFSVVGFPFYGVLGSSPLAAAVSPPGLYLPLSMDAALRQRTMAPWAT
jgi:hypothetical protein